MLYQEGSYTLSVNASRRGEISIKVVLHCNIFSMVNSMFVWLSGGHSNLEVPAMLFSLLMIMMLPKEY